MNMKTIVIIALMLPALAACKSAYSNSADDADATSSVATDTVDDNGQVRNREREQTNENTQGAG